MEDPNRHLSIFLEVSNTSKLNEVYTDVIWLHLFSFSLKDNACAWLYLLPPDSITTCTELTIAFLTKFPPPKARQ